MRVPVLLLALLASLSLAACGPSKAEKEAQQEAQRVNLVAAEAFLAKNAKEPGVITLPDGLQYKIVKSGPLTGPKPALADEVKVHYEGKLVDGTVFDSSYARGMPASFPLNGLVPAWKTALVKMRPGDEWILYVPPALGYGDVDKGPIPANSVMIFRIELIGVLPASGTVQNG